jgi:drug/metabolite transporter (DMT)-like permease
MSAYLGALGAFTASVTWAFASTRYAEVARTEGAVRVGLLRALSASALWLLALAATDGVLAWTRIDARQALCLTGSIVCSYALGDRVFFAAASRLGVSSALAIATIYPLWAALFGALVRGEPLGTRRSIGIVLCLAGVSAVLRMSRDARQPASEARSRIVGAALALLTSLFWAGNAVLLKLGADGLSIYQANSLRFTIGVLLLLMQLKFMRGVVVGAQLPMRSLARRLRVALLADVGLGSICFVYGIAHTDLALGATLSSLSPLVALPIAVYLGTERIEAGKVFAVCLTLLGVVLLVSTA